MNQRNSQSLGILLFIGLIGLGPGALSGGESAPNILVFLVDDMGVMDSSVAFLTDETGAPRRYPLNEFYRTPNMQRLADQGIRFSQFYAMSVCSPTRVSLMTGQNAARHRTTNWINPDQNNGGPQGPPDWNWRGLQPGDVTLASLLQQAGYHTIHVGKGHFAPRHTPGADPSNLGFDVNVAGAAFGAPGSYYGQQNYGFGGRRAHHAVPDLEAYHGTDVFLTEALTREAKRELTAAVEARKPFFLHMSHYAVHAPFEPDPRFAPHYADSGKSPAAQAFATLIEGIDQSLGDLLDHLEELGVAQNTLVFFLGDNGSDAPLGHQHEVACAAPLRGKKGAHYEGGMRVPFIAAWGKLDSDHPIQQRLPIAVGGIQTLPAAVHDLFPTILAEAEVELPENHTLDGISLAPLLQGTPNPQHPATFLMHYPHAPHRSDYFSLLRSGDWKVIYHYFPAANADHGHYELFHLGKDPFEQQDLSGAHPEELQRLTRELIDQLEQHQAVYPVSEDGTPAQPVVPEHAGTP
jgi:arylsulfatase A-like enzyme